MPESELDTSETYPRIRPVEASHIADLIRIAEETNLSTWTAQNYLDELQIPESIMLRLESATNETIGFIVGRVVQGASVEATKVGGVVAAAVGDAVGEEWADDAAGGGGAGRDGRCL